MRKKVKNWIFRAFHFVELYIGPIVVYISIIAVFYLYYRKAIPLAPHEEGPSSLAKAIIDSLSNTYTILTAVAEGIFLFMSCLRNKSLPQIEMLIFSIAFFLLVCGNYVIVDYYNDAVLVVFYDGVIFVAGMFALLFRMPDDRKKAVITNPKVLGFTKNKKIIGEQLFAVNKTEGEMVTYTLNSTEYFVRAGYDINGMLSISYNIPVDVDTSFRMIRDSYLSFIDDGNEGTKKQLIKLLNIQEEKLTAELRKIKSANDVKPGDCCLARILLIYLAFLQILDPTPQDNQDIPFGNEYLGELAIKEGRLKINIEIEKRLFTLLRTGILGAVLLGPELRYFFSYQKDGYKAGRKYSAIRLPNDDNSSTGYICLFTLECITEERIPPYIVAAVKKEEDRIKKAINREEEG